MSGQTAPGGKITYADLMDLAFHSSQLGDSLQSWKDWVGAIEVSAGDLDQQVKKLPQSWNGWASDLAQDAITQTGEQLQGQAALIHEVAEVLQQHYSNIVQLANNLSILVQDPTALPSATTLVAPFPGGKPPTAPNGEWGPSQTWPLPTILRSAYTVAPGLKGGPAGGTVQEEPAYVAELKSAGISQTDIDWWKNAYQDEITWYLSKANALDEAAAAELQKLMPKTTTKTKTKTTTPQPPTVLGNTTVTVVAWGSDPKDPAAGTLWGIAQQEYKNGAYWPLIYQANQDKFGGNWGPNDIQPTWQIYVPPLKPGTPIPEPPANAGTPA